MSLDKPRLQLFRLAPLTVVLLGICAAAEAQRLGLGSLAEPGPGLWPFMVAVFVVATGLIVTVGDDAAGYLPWNRQSWRVVVALLSLGVYVGLFQTVGFTLATAFTLVVWLRVLGQEPWRWTVALAVPGTVLIHLLFVNGLSVPVPEPTLLPGLPWGA